MSKYHNDNSYATDPGGVRLSIGKLKELEPDLMTDRTFKGSAPCPADHPAQERLERYAEHLMLGDSRAALVVSVKPLVVAAYSSDLDAVILLRFPDVFVDRYGLNVGSRLLTVNTYGDVRSKAGRPFYAVDLIPGPRRGGNWTNYSPFIADFLSDDADRIEARKREIDEQEWAEAGRLAKLRIDRWGIRTARSGRPTLASVPTRISGAAYFQPLDRLPRGQSSLPAWLSRGVVKWALLGLAGLAGLLVLHFAK